MKKILFIFLLYPLFLSSAYARDTIENYSVSDTLALEQSKNILGDDISFYFGKQEHPPVIKSFVEFRTNNKTNAFNKTDKEACQWVFLSAMKALRNKAISQGGNAVINIKSNYRDNLTVSNTTFQCGAGAIIAGVALVGDVVTLNKTAVDNTEIDDYTFE
ncbi:excinuclease ABC subunit A [Shewanella surugensis]|uniref:Excinuclease ABC subunit A n=1 Tax=Shewanella surugensis TaxID=212020 RepID=A0ABT0LHK2_9GAMM|nr:excinuclease ABC subunit A [Shewanella surugensis]MCL1127044.1 excinuclease ABC subunit A [Shewanella surugensis]